MVIKNDRLAELAQRYGVKLPLTHSRKVREVRFKPVKEEPLMLTEAAAWRHLELAEIDGDRKLRQDWVDDYVEKTKRGTFIWSKVELVSIFCKEDNVTYRGDGQHSCWVRNTVAPDADWGPRVRHTHYVVKTQDELRELYSIFDRQHTRTTKHVINARLFGCDDFDGLSKRTISSIVEGYRHWRWETQRQKKTEGTVDKTIDQLQKHHVSLAKQVATLLGENGQNRHIWRSPVVAAMFATTERCPSSTEAFWSAVKTGLELGPNDPRYRLREYLKDTTLVSTNVSMTNKNRQKIAGVETMMRVCIHCWNSWRRGEPLRQPARPQTGTHRPAVHG